MTEPKVIFEDKSILVVDKPSGWITNSAGTTKGQPVLQEWLTERKYPISSNLKLRSGIVHRLDKETSGVIVVAKTEEVMRALQGQFKSRKVKKMYIALVHGVVEPSDGEINVPTGRLPWNRVKFGVLPGGRESLTKYKAVSTLKNENDKFSLVEFYPKTGRTHQIRIHSKYLGNPIVADSFYAGRKVSRNDRLWCKRLFLHAAKISFIHPSKNEDVSYKSELPEELKSVLGNLKEL